MDERGCKKPGQNRTGTQCFRCGSAALANTDLDRLYECPTGYIYRVAPWAWDALRAHRCVESGGFGLHQQSQWVQDAVGVIGSEQQRHFEARQEKKRNASDASYASRVLRSGRG